MRRKISNDQTDKIEQSDSIIDFVKWKLIARYPTIKNLQGTHNKAVEYTP